MMKAIGSRGSWFANVGGESLPCVHKYWWQNAAGYNDKDLGLDNPKAAQFVAAISSGKRVILTTGNPEFDQNKKVIGFERTGYIAVYSVDDVRFDQEGLRFKFLKREVDLE